MTFRTIALAAAVLAPVLSFASSNERGSFDACTKAFADELTSSGLTPGPVKANYRGSFASSSVLNFFPTEYSFDLEARDRKTGTPIARVRCSTTAHGTVKTLSALPLSNSTATLADRR